MTIDTNRLNRQAEAFRSLHRKGDPLTLFNVWDARSARAVEASGARALATTSWAVAHAAGLEDGEVLHFESQLRTVDAIRRATTLLLSVDIERGYAETLSELRTNIGALIDAGVVGVNLEDGLPGGGLREVREQAERIAAVREAAAGRGVDLFVNARTDVFFAHGETGAAADEAAVRGAAYVGAGASGVFLPGLGDPDLVRRLCAEIPAPVNLMVGLDADFAALGNLGVSRLSIGPAGYLAARASTAEAVAPEMARWARGRD